MTTETMPFLLTAKQLQTCCHDVGSKPCFWIHLLQKDPSSDAHSSTDKQKDQQSFVDNQQHRDTQDPLSATCVTLDKVERVRSKGSDSIRSTCSLNVDPEGETGLYMLRPSLLPQLEELFTKTQKFVNNTDSHEENYENNKSVEGEGSKEGACVGCNGVTNLFGISGLVFRNVPVNLWSLPAFHELLLRGDFPPECEPVKLLGQRLEMLLAPFGVSLVPEQGALRLMAQPMGLVGKLFSNGTSNNISHISVTVSLNLDLLAVLLFSLPDWRLLWSRDRRFLTQFALRPSAGTPFDPFSLFPEHFTFDISFWTGPMWDEKKFYAVVREASHGTVEQVKLIDTFSHPDLSQTSYCYRLTYHSHTHALSHTQALQFHKHLESLVSSRLEVTIR